MVVWFKNNVNVCYTSGQDRVYTNKHPDYHNNRRFTIYIKL